ncbi:MAG: hypothetical protein Q8R65_04020 [Polynucleobacter sp.]|nr:hypothetical protein [Polynucleobacter sp.]
MKLYCTLLLLLLPILSGCSQDQSSLNLKCIGDPIQLGVDFVRAGREERRTYAFHNRTLEGYVCRWSQEAIYCSQMQSGTKLDLVIKRTYPSIVSEIRTSSGNQMSLFQGKCEASFKSI